MSLSQSQKADPADQPAIGPVHRRFFEAAQQLLDRTTPRARQKSPN
jgi:hypothetical protein